VHFAQGVLYKFVYFDEKFFWGGYYQNTKISTIYETNKTITYETILLIRPYHETISTISLTKPYNNKTIKDGGYFKNFKKDLTNLGDYGIIGSQIERRTL
jgi:hypothetical protein